MLHKRPMVPTGLDPAACVDQVDRVASSSLLQGSEALCRLMKYLADHSLQTPRAHLKEYQIATEVLGRPADFDPHSDSSVRVQIGRLRSKLAEYYGAEGLHDPIVIDIPKGRYTLSFQARQDPPQSPPAIQLVPLEDPDPEDLAPVVQSWRRPLVFGVIAIVLVSAIVLMAFRHPIATSSVFAKHKVPQPPTALEVLWTPFLRGTSEPFVVFKNSLFVGDAATGMRRFDPARDNPNQEVQRYTGVGEVMGVLELDQLFSKFGGHFRVKRGSLFTVDDARDSNLIFVGSPGRNADLNEIPSTHQFTFRRVPDSARRFRMAVIDNHPPLSSPAVYVAPTGVHTDEVEYAIVGLERGLDPSHWTFFLEGTSTVATEAAVDFVCSENSISDLLKRLHVQGTSDLKPFEGLIRVKVAHDVPLETQLLDVRFPGD